jgi:hypothetical protein
MVTPSFISTFYMLRISCPTRWPARLELDQSCYDVAELEEEKRNHLEQVSLPSPQPHQLRLFPHPLTLPVPRTRTTRSYANTSTTSKQTLDMASQTVPSSPDIDDVAMEALFCEALPFPAVNV